jgi:uncharacterized membrane protein
MIPFPSPLHPAVVHFPIVLILAGTVVAVVSVFLRRWHLPWLSALVLAAGAAGAIAATYTGGQEAETAGELSPAAEQILEEHEEWGEMTRNLAVAAALLATAAAAAAKVRVAGRGLSTVAAACALAAASGVAQAGHYGGQLVYHHGVGLNTAAAASAGEVLPQAAERPARDDD